MVIIGGKKFDIKGENEMEEKVKIQVLGVFGWAGAIEGMRNPKNSWKREDSVYSPVLEIGPNDLKLMKSLIKGGSEHRKFLRMIHVQLNMWLPRYIWSEFDTYHFNVKNSCSTMHKLLTNEPITLDQFIYDVDDKNSSFVMEKTVEALNEIRLKYLQAEDNEEKKILLRQAKQLLPEGFIQKRTVDTNYEELLTIYKQRIKHRLPEWQEICAEIKKLPYFEELFLTE